MRVKDMQKWHNDERKYMYNIVVHDISYMILSNCFENVKESV